MKSIRLLLTLVIFSSLFTGCMPPGNDPNAKSSSGGSFQFIFLALMIVVFWLFFIRPQSKKAKNQKNFIQNLQKGDKVVTIAGIHGTINKVNDDSTLHIEISPGSYIKIEKSAISMDWTAALQKAGTEIKK